MMPEDTKAFQQEEQLNRLRIRWRRWLGQKMRFDREDWTDLLNCNWSCWAYAVLNRVGWKWCKQPRLHTTATRLDVYACWDRAIEEASYQELQKLDSIYLSQKMERR